MVKQPLGEQESESVLDDFQSMDQLYWQSKQNKPEQFTGNDEDESKKFEEK